MTASSASTITPASGRTEERHEERHAGEEQSEIICTITRAPAPVPTVNAPNADEDRQECGGDP